MQIAVELDQADVNALDRRLKYMREEAPRALRNAINRTATTARKQLVSKTREIYTYGKKNKDITSHMSTKRATVGDLTAIIYVRGGAEEMKEFDVSGGVGQGNILTALINTTNGSKGFGSKGFQNQVGSYYGPFIRKGASRFPIEKLYSLSVPSMVGNQGQVYGPTEPMIMEQLQTQVQAAVDKILGG